MMDSESSRLVIDTIYGTSLIGTFLGLAVYGVTMQQFFFYFTTFHALDAKHVQLWVATLAVLETCYMGTSMAWVYQLLIDNFGHIPNPRPRSWLMALYFIFAAIMISLVQIFFGWRIYALLKSKWILYFIAVGAVLTSGSGIAVGVLSGFAFPSYQKQTPHVVAGIIWNLCVTACDLTITSTLTVYLFKKRAELKLHADSLVNNVMKLTIQNGLLTTVVQFINLFLVLLGDGGQYRITFFLSPILFVSAGLAAVNARYEWRQKTRSTQLSLDINFNKQSNLTIGGLVTMQTGQSQPLQGASTSSVAGAESHEMDHIKSHKRDSLEAGDTEDIMPSRSNPTTYNSFR